MDHQQQESNSVTDDSSKDVISKLPDEVLTKILSVYPLDSGSKAVAMLTGLWYRPCIKHGEIQDFECAISEFLVNFDENDPLKMPRKLEYHFSEKLIASASIGLNKKLNLDFSKGKQEFPRQFGWEIVLNTMDFAHSSPYPFSVKTLKLTSVKYLSCEFISSLINKFRYVETLIIEKCDGLRSLRIEGLAKLMKISILDCVHLKSVYLEALELKTLHYCGLLCWFSLKNVMYVEDVKLEFVGQGFNHMKHDLYNPLLRAVRDVRVLTLNGWVYKKAFEPLLFSKQNEQHFRFSKLEDLWWIDNSMEDNNMNWLFCFLKFCTSLKRLFITIDPQSYSKPCTSDHHSSLQIQKAQLRKLKVVKLEGFENEIEIMYFNERLMQVFSAEPRVVDVRQGMHARCLKRFPKRQGIRRATESNKLKFSYKFVEEVEDNRGLCSKHPHMP